MSEITRENAPCAAKAAPPCPALGADGACLLVLAASIAAGYIFCHHFGFALPGMGLWASQWALTAGTLLLAAKRGVLRARGHGEGWFLLACALLLGAAFGIFSDDSLRAMNLPVTLLLTVQALFSLTGQNDASSLSAQGLREGLHRLLPAPFRFWDAPFRSIRFSAVPRTGLLLGIGLAVPVAGIAIALLSCADGVFGDLLAEGLTSLGRTDGSLVYRLVFTLLLTLMLFSLLFGLLQPPREVKPAEGRHAPPLMFAVVLVVLGLIYALFVYIQFRYLFGGTETARMAGGYAQYARNGFFELVAVALLNLTLIFSALTLCPESRTVRILCAVTAVLTGLLDYSAFFRMRLYTEAFGLSVLRIVTLWGMVMILLALVLSLVKAARPHVRISVLLLIVLTGTWVGLNYLNVSRVTAQDHVRRYNEGKMESLDIAYLSQSPDAYPALEAIADAQARHLAQDACLARLSARQPGWYDSSLSWRSLRHLLSLRPELHGDFSGAGAPQPGGLGSSPAAPGGAAMGDKAPTARFSRQE